MPDLAAAAPWALVVAALAAAFVAGLRRADTLIDDRRTRDRPRPQGASDAYPARGSSVSDGTGT